MDFDDPTLAHPMPSGGGYNINAEQIYVAMHNWRSPERAAYEAGISLTDVLKLMMDRRLRIGKYTLNQGFAGILIDATTIGGTSVSLEVCALFFGLPVAQLRRYWSNTESRTVKPAMRHYLSPQAQVKAAMSASEIEAFRRDYVSFKHLGVELGLSPQALRQWLNGRGIFPLPQCPDLFRRSDIPAS